MTGFRQRFITEPANRCAIPLSGIYTVAYKQIRSRSLGCDILLIFALLVLNLVISGLLQGFTAPNREYTGELPRFLLRWLTMGAAGAALIYLPFAAVMGAFAAPTAARRDEIQSALMTRLSALDICAGGLIAGMWPLFFALLLSCAFWIAAQVAMHILPDRSAGVWSILLAHISIAAASFATCSISFLFSIRHLPGRHWGRGSSFGLIWTGLSVLSLFMIEPILSKWKDPSLLIDGALLINPVSASASSLNVDILRFAWLYEHTSAHDYPFMYPSPIYSVIVFSSVGLAMLGISALRLRRAYGQ